MEKKYHSKALEANLAETRYKNIVLPQSHRAFIQLSAEYYGINKRANEAIIEFHHPYSNRKFVIEQFREILLTDYWFYSSVAQPLTAYDCILSFFEVLLHEPLKIELRILAIETILDFMRKSKLSTPLPKAVLDRCLSLLSRGFTIHSAAFIECSHTLTKTFSYLSELQQLPTGSKKFVLGVLDSSLKFWQETSRIEEWLSEKTALLSQSYPNLIQEIGRPYFQQIRKKMKPDISWDAIQNQIPVYRDVASHFAKQTGTFHQFIDQFYFTFYLLHLPGMARLRDRIIWDLNKTLRLALDEIKPNARTKFIDLVFELSQDLRKNHTAAILDTLATLGKKIIQLDQTTNKYYINYFEKRIIGFGFETPGIVFVNEDWQLEVNPNHIKNIRVWLELIESSQSVMEKLLAALIANLRLGGIFINDTDLFQREITKILNSNIAPYYKKVKQLTRIFPVYFNEIGAEGEIRKITTSMDEISGRQDRLIHFLRKQVHTESNNKLIELAKRIVAFWYDGDLEQLQPHLPADVFDSIDKNSEWFVPVHELLNRLCREHQCSYQELMEWPQSKLFKQLNRLPNKNDRDVGRLRDIITLYARLKEKYSFDTVSITELLRKHPFFTYKETEQLEKALRAENLERSLKLIYSFMDKLRQVIFNPKESESWENIYHKRHIAIGIPSMYGIYRENKFEALGLTFRLEKVATRLMEKVVNQINLNYISAKTLNRIYTILEYFREGLALDGISSQGLNSNLQMLRYSLTSQSFTLDQYINIFQFIADDIKRIIDKYFLRSYEYPLQVIIPQLFFSDPALTEKEKQQISSQKSEAFYREIISSAFLVQPLDNLISKVLKSLQNMVDNLPAALIRDVMSYNSDLIISPLYQSTMRMDNQIFLGSKAYYLKKLRLAGFPIPPGFVLTTEVFRRRNAINNHPEIKKEIDRKLTAHLYRLEKITGCRFGDPKHPLLLSVRSGTAISMPGAMDTFLNVGMNDQFTEALSKKPNFAWTSWDCYRRLLQLWGMAHGIERDTFDQIMLDYKAHHGVDLKINFPPAIMRDMAYSYKTLLLDHQVHFEEHLMEQLKTTINHVLNSWSSERAKVYREHLQIADEWGTAVVVQKMVLGNLNKNSGTGVVFTQNPKRERPGVHLYGDFAICSQGEDIVSGLINTLPVGETQRRQLNLSKGSLQSTLPSIYKKLHSLATDMTEHHGFSPQEIEFTFESSNPHDFYILQTRDQDIRKKAKVAVFSSPRKEMQLAGRGIGIGGGAMNGYLAFDMDDLLRLRKTHPKAHLILVRPDTVPDDIGMIFECDGLLTGKGGATSHAAVTAVRLGKVCVVNCSEMYVDEESKNCMINGHQLINGDQLAIDGHAGNIFLGHYPMEVTEIKSTL